MSGFIGFCIAFQSNHVSNKNHCMSTLLQPVPLEPHQRRNLPGSQLLGRQKKQLIIPRTVRVSLLNQVSANVCILFHSLIDLRLLRSILNFAKHITHMILLTADKPTYDADDPSQTFFCGTSWDEADRTCGMRCPSGNSGDCPG